LAWGTPSENMQDCIAHGTHANANKECCGYDHPLQPPNLVANALRAGKRQCKACHWTYAARARAKQRGQVIDFRAVADDYYMKITAEETARLTPRTVAGVNAISRAAHD
jgi:hypothetical protein